ncbi:hypothetical protein [uncultured Jatrophihabitans sp.]|uniref:hypothetical protein n=1 Tax=uncultured Jatrophihabitans sp. TaxID=1610747 RepID=UPI0035CA2EA3
MAEFEGRQTYFRPEVSPPDGPSPLGRRGYGSCTFCHSSDTVWQHDLNASLCRFRTMFGKGKVWSTSHKVCDRCEHLYNASEYAALARLQTTNPPSYDDELADHLIGLAAFCRADRGPRELEQPDFPPGFEPWEEYTGADFVFGVWPEERRAVVDGVELVASPWPSLDLTAVFRVLWTWAERDKPDEVTATLMIARVAEVLAWPETNALSWLAEQR